MTGHSSITTTQRKEETINIRRISECVEHILYNDGPLDTGIEEGLHRMLSDLNPHQALIAIAATAGAVARQYLRASPAMTALHDEARQVLGFYEADADEAAVLRGMARCAQDLDIIAELLELNLGFLSAKHRASQTLCRLLAFQARTHIQIAEEHSFFYRQNVAELQAAPSYSRSASPSPHAAIAIARVLDPDCSKIIAFPQTTHF